METPKLTVFIQSVEGRPVWDQVMRPLLEASDIGKDYTRLTQKRGADWKTHFLNVLCEMSLAKTEYVVRFEDDCVGVNKHIKHNLLTWPVLKEANFGVGWGYRPGYIPGWNDKWWFGGLAGSLCTIFRTADMPAVIDYCSNCNLPQDIAMSQAVSSMRREVCIHGPSLVEHAIGTPSEFGNRHGCDSTSGRFMPDWKR